MKKYSLFLLILVVALSFCGCNATKNADSAGDTTSAEAVVGTEELIITENGVTYLKDSAETLEITCSYYDDVERKEFKIKDSAFYNKLKKVINGKEVCEYSCKCAGDYQIGLNDNYSLHIHPDRITVNIKLNEYNVFTVECSEKEMKELYDYIESKK